MGRIELGRGSWFREMVGEGEGVGVGRAEGRAGVCAWCFWMWSMISRSRVSVYSSVIAYI